MRNILFFFLFLILIVCIFGEVVDFKFEEVAGFYEKGIEVEEVFCLMIENLE